MNHLELELFITLLTCRNLSEAATKIVVSQPRASQLLQRLEREMGCKLFDRSSAGLEPTNAALAFRPFAEQMLAARLEGLRASQEACEGMYGALHVGMSHTTSAFTVPFIMRRFHRAFPHVRLTLTKSMPPQLLTGMETDALDLCLCFKPTRTAPFVWEKLFETELVGMYAPDFDGVIDDKLAKFARLPLVLPSRHCTSRVLLDVELQKLGVVPKIVMEIDDSTSLTSMVRHGLAVSIVPRTMVKPSRQLRITPLRSPQVSAEAGIMSKRNRSRIAAAFVDMIHKEIALRRESTIGSGLDPEHTPLAEGFE